MAESKNINFSVTADNSDNMAKSVIRLNRAMQGSRSAVDSVSAAWAIFANSFYFSISLIDRASTSIKSAFSLLRKGANLAEAEKNFRAYTKSIGKIADEPILKCRTQRRHKGIELILVLK